MNYSEIAMEMAPIYILIRDDDYFRVMQITYNTGDSGPIRTYPAITEIYQRWKNIIFADSVQCEYKQSCVDFFTLYLIITAGEKEQRIFLGRITANDTRNITYLVEQPRRYLKESISGVIRQEVYSDLIKPVQLSVKEINKLVRDRLTMIFPTSKKFDELIEQAIASTKTELGFPAVDPVEFSYQVTDTVVATATSEQCKEYLERQQVRLAIFPHELDSIRLELESKYSDEAERVFTALKETKSREHLSAFSITSERGQTLVSIVNMQRQHIKMESWKFLALIQRAGESLRLTELSKVKMGEPLPLFTFNNCKEGVVVGRFDILKSVIEVVCLKDGTDAITDRATFVVDSTYTLCIYAALKRLQDDSERFKKLREDAQTLVKVRDPFDFVYHPLTT